MKEIIFRGNLITKTDTKGKIVDVNETFVEISGFSRGELIGSAHNIVRHPDMPKIAFQQMWKTLTSGRPWRGIIKNKTKGGDFYWVDAFVVPIRENGVVVGYASVRQPPSREAIDRAQDAYSRGRLPGRARTYSIRAKLVTLALSGVMGASLLAGAGYLDGKRSELRIDSILKVHELLDHASTARFWLKEQEGQVFKALQHNPGYAVSALHDHPLDRHTGAILSASKRIVEAKDKILQAKLEGDLADKAKSFDFHSTKVGEIIEKINAELAGGDFEKAAYMMTKILVPAYNEFDKIALDFIEAARMDAIDTADHGQEDRETNLYILLGTLISTLVMLFVISAAIYHTMLKRIRSAETEMAKIASGDISSRPEIGQEDEIGRMIESVATTAVSLNVLVEEVRRHADAIAKKGGGLSQSMASISTASQNQLDRVVEVAGAINGVSSSVQMVAQNATAAAKNTVETHRAVESSIAQLSESIQASERVIQSVKGAEETIGGLIGSIHAIGQASKSIREIADQTNLLALNAAIEAARAGDQGRGFAVVADEVRKLAEKTAAATSEIESVVRQIGGEAEAASLAMNQTVEDVDDGIGRMRSSGSSIEGITALTERVTEMTQGIATSADEQGRAAERVSVATSDISHLIEQTNQSVSLASASAKELTNTAGLLISSVSRFKI